MNALKPQTKRTIRIAGTGMSLLGALVLLVLALLPEDTSAKAETD